MIQSLFLLSPTGEVLIERHFRGVVTHRSVCDSYWATVLAADPDPTTSGPSAPHHHDPMVEVSTDDNDSTQRTLYVISIRRDDVSYLAICPSEVSPLMILSVLHRMAHIFRDYFGGLADETAVTENFSTIYQLLEEMIDYGWPLTFEENALKSMIRPPSVIAKLMTGMVSMTTNSGAGGGGSGGHVETLPSGATSNMPWRSDVTYTQNEIYVDILEEVDAIIDSHGLVISTNVRGSIQVRSYLSGTPDLLLTFNNPAIVGDDCSFHPCVRYARYEKERVVSFVPPDGEFELMRYRVDAPRSFVPPVTCHAQWGTGRLTLQVGVGSLAGLVFSNLARVKAVEELVVRIPFPKGTKNLYDIQKSTGEVFFDEAKKILQWKVADTMDSSQKATLSCKFTLGPVVGTSKDHHRLSNNNNNNKYNNQYNNKYNNNAFQEPMSEKRRLLCQQHHQRKQQRPPHTTQQASAAASAGPVLPEFSPPHISLGWKIPLASVSGLSVSGLSLLRESYRPYKGVRNVTAAGPVFQVRCNS
jgi:AP-3 complex subunit mu